MRTLALGALLFQALFAAVFALPLSDWLYPQSDHQLSVSRVGALLFAAASVGFAATSLLRSLPLAAGVLALGSAITAAAIPLVAGAIGIYDVAWMVVFSAWALVPTLLAIVAAPPALTGAAAVVTAVRSVRRLALFATVLSLGAVIHSTRDSLRGLAVDRLLLVESIIVALALVAVGLALSSTFPRVASRLAFARPLRDQLSLLLVGAGLVGLVGLRDLFLLQAPLLVAAGLLAFAVQGELGATNEPKARSEALPE